MLPNFNRDGLLPPGDYTLTLDQLKKSHLVTGACSEFSDTWDQEWRADLVERASILIKQLWTVGIQGIWLDGYFDCAKHVYLSGELQQQLNSLDPHQIWTWDPQTRRPFANFPKRQLPMWYRYRVELYPHYQQLSGIRDKYGNDLQFPSAFRLSRRGDHPKGIIHIIQSED